MADFDVGGDKVIVIIQEVVDPFDDFGEGEFDL
jgi:hypothetical protein